MDKQNLLSSIKQLSSQNQITKDEILRAYEEGNEKKSISNVLAKEVGLIEVLYMVGGIIVVIGISVLVFQNWNSLNSINKILITLGSGIITYIAGVLLNREDKYGALGYAFHLIAAFLLPLGLGVLLNQIGYGAILLNAGMQSLITAFLLILYLFSYFIFRKSIFTLISIIYASLFFFRFTDFLTAGMYLSSNMQFYEYRFLSVGLSYLFLGYNFSFNSQKALTGSLYGFGTAFVLGAVFGLSGWKPNQSLIWELIFPVVVSGVLYFSVRFKSKPSLILGTVYLMFYILKITSEYFSATLGWPLSLIICGITLIGVGYYAFTLNKKYISS